MKATTYYTPIAAVNLADYLDRGCILPRCILSGQQHDLQNIFQNGVLLSLKMWTGKNDCSLQVTLTDEEVAAAKPVAADFVVFTRPIPLSRVRAIYFADEKLRENTAWNINNGTAFVLPNVFTKKVPQSKRFFADATQLANADAGRVVFGESDARNVEQYDRILGGLAFARLGSQEEEPFPRRYYSILANLNKLIREQYLEGRQEIEKGIDWLFSDDDASADWRSRVFREVTVTSVEEYAKQIGLPLEKKYGVFKLDRIDTSTKLYGLAVLASYGNGKRQSTEDLVAAIHSGVIPKERAEGIALLFGISNGYSSLRNAYKVRGGSRDAKFRMNSKCDYYAVESIYQWVFNGKKDSSTFPYIDTWCPKTKKTSPVTKDVFAFKVLDQILVPQKQPPKNNWHPYVQRMFSILLSVVDGVPALKARVTAARLESLIATCFQDFESEIRRECGMAIKSEPSATRNEPRLNEVVANDSANEPPPSTNLPSVQPQESPKPSTAPKEQRKQGLLFNDQSS